MFSEFAKSQKNKKQNFLEKMESLVPWEEFTEILGEYYEEKKGGRKKMDLKLMLKIHFLQEWFGLSDGGMESEIYDSVAFQNFLGLSLVDRVPDETTILRFRHFLEAHDLGKKLLEKNLEQLQKKGLYMKKGSIVDATIVKASSSTKNKEKKRDPEMASTRKNKNYHFGMKIHAGYDMDSGIVHTVRGTAANVSDKKVLPECLHGEEKAIIADKGYIGQKEKKEAREKGLYWGVLDKGSPKRSYKLSGSQKKRNQKLASIRAKGEHFFLVKHTWKCAKVRFRGISKNLNAWNIKAVLFNLKTCSYAFMPGYQT